jgi:biopolymer transport protein ExbD
MKDPFIYVPPATKARVEIIPLIDVIFFLLATFVLFTLSLNKITSLETILPAGGDPSHEADTTVYIHASEHGTFYWKQGANSLAEPITASEIPSRLLDYKSRTPLPRVLVRGDDSAKFGSAVMVLDQVRKAGISQVSIETKRSATGN